MTHLLDIRSLTVRFGGVTALDDVDLYMDPGEVVAVLGANGAGKSTLLRSISHLVERQAKQMRFAGTCLLTTRPAHIAASGLIHVPEGRQVFSRLSVMDNLRLGEFPLVKSGRAAVGIDAIFEIFPKLAERRHQLAGTMSGGEQQMLAVGRGLMGNPRLLILDEPSMGLAPVITAAIYDAMQKIKHRTSLLIVEQNTQAIRAIADRIYVLQSGRVVHVGTNAETSDEIVLAAYLGMNADA